VIKLLDIVSPPSLSDDNDFVFLILEYVDTDLRHFLDRVQRKNLPLNENDVIKLLYNLVCGLNFIHTANIMHRDLKPANVLITPDY